MSSEFTVAPDGNQEIATCSTSVVNPNNPAQPPPTAAADYRFLAYCKVTPSVGAVIHSAQCPAGTPGASGNPTAQCSVTFEPQPNVTYTINSNHYLTFAVASLGTVCGQPLFYEFCFSDPLGYYSMNPSAPDPWPAVPVYPSANASNTVDETCGAGGGTCTPQNIPYQYCLSGFLGFGVPICTDSIYARQFWPLAQTSAIWTPKCADVIQGSVTAVNPPIAPTSYDEGCRINATFTPNFGFTIAQAAQVCGFTNFDWQQYITALPAPSPFIAVGGGVPLQAPRAFLDPPPGGYTYELTAKDSNGNLLYPTGDNAFPFYYNPNLNPGQLGQTELESQEPQGANGAALLFVDEPQDPCLFGGIGVGTPYCSGSGAGILGILQFQTDLVGVNPDGTPYDLGVGLSWNSTCDGTSGGAAVTKNSQPADPGSGTGRSTITSVNETTNYQYPKAPGVPALALTFLGGNQIAVTGSGLAYSRVSKLFVGTLTITNDSENTITGPFQIVLDSLQSNVTLTNETGTFGGWPYLTVPNVTSLEPGQPATVNVRFSNPTNEILNFIPMVYSGSFN